MKFRKKPVIIEAVQLKEDNIREVYSFIHPQQNFRSVDESQIGQDRWQDFENIIRRDGLQLKTPESGEGTQIASIGDWIVKGFSSELGYHFWPVKPDYFAENYEPVTNT